jgi:hypothetical protein
VYIFLFYLLLHEKYTVEFTCAIIMYLPPFLWFSLQVIRVKWSLHAREEIVFELLQHLSGNTTRDLLEGIRKSTREMIEEQEAVRGRLFTIQDVMQSTVRAWLQVYKFYCQVLLTSISCRFFLSLPILIVAKCCSYMNLAVMLILCSFC